MILTCIKSQKVGNLASFESMANPGTYMVLDTSTNLLVQGTEADTADFKIKSTFKIVDCFFSFDGGVSLQSAYMKNSYIRHQMQTLYVHVFQANSLYYSDACFGLRQGLADQKGVTFEASGYPSQYILQSQSSKGYKLTPNSEAEDYKIRATFFSRPPNWLVIDKIEIHFDQTKEQKNFLSPLQVEKITLSNTGSLQPMIYNYQGATNVMTTENLLYNQGTENIDSQTEYNMQVDEVTVDLGLTTQQKLVLKYSTPTTSFKKKFRTKSSSKQFTFNQDIIIPPDTPSQDVYLEIYRAYISVPFTATIKYLETDYTKQFQGTYSAIEPYFAKVIQ
eukprot:403376471